MRDFALRVANKVGDTTLGQDYGKLHKWSVRFPEKFWEQVIDFFPVVFSGENRAAQGCLGFLHYPWFPHVKLNFAENLLAHGGQNAVAMVSLHESGKRQQVTYGQLRKSVAKLQAHLENFVGEGDVVACYMPNIPETVIGLLAAVSLGGIFTSTSCDFGVEGVVDRFAQTEPKVLITVSAYTYGGKVFDLSGRIGEIKRRLPSVEEVIVVDFLQGELGRQGQVPHTTDFSQVMKLGGREKPRFVPRAFSDPLCIMYSSGTTGKPKCIVHSVGGTLLQHIKELGLHTDVKEGKNITYFTTCGWMMWNWLVSSLFFGAKLTLYEGAPHSPSLQDFVNLIHREGIHIFGTSPKLLRALENELGENLGSHFPSLETILSTGAPLLPEQFDYVYKAFKKDVLLASVCGGTDILSCFMLGNPILPVRRGEIQAPGLGMDVAAFDEQGQALWGERGELVCRTPFVSQPIGFWGGDRERFYKSYFEKYPGVWSQGDFITITDNGGVVVHGRSDATLNPGGVRIGTAEIYRQTETISYIDDSLCVGYPRDGDVDIVLFIQLVQGENLTPERVVDIKKAIRQGASPRHVPQHIYQVSAIPYTRSGKKMELPIAQLLQGKGEIHMETMVNPECLGEYKSILLNVFLR